MTNEQQDYRQLMASLTERLRGGERDIDLLVRDARESLKQEGNLSVNEIDRLTISARRDLQEFARIYGEYAPSHRIAPKPTSEAPEEEDSVFMRVIKESLWRELADITDKTQLEWKEVFKDVNHHGVYHSGEVVGLGDLICEKCHFHLAVYTPEILSKCPECGNDEFSRRPFEP
ncbi:zinc ribbon-containing protein [Rouxiella badensis]|jgi:predicted Zn-ribbon and HTH transcriptional regulator|uniref:Zinc ribbon-containing protein n=1 Tax=Rouxiella badensis TaxID=1646377 RepID=A0A1X0WLA8_9GAMM|nr:zinc ribbon-containing protein [Rouxiella badensis]MCC3702296.1 zinc ribbon-containing protein [Rouxiella badensis]MCC3717302.1 zinc ribbon-containing protein [Rouxiella badensis]MCC3728398.1 zinc ribbon-containing protein [Rouxiella badensis]MCC3732302.1 zinc ribbon-containing protein [Rouxiella badensis]MCC3740142.1 zinc ribbon-containing protein [Rouxiella badensis]